MTRQERIFKIAEFWYLQSKAMRSIKPCGYHKILTLRDWIQAEEDCYLNTPDNRVKRNYDSM